MTLKRFGRLTRNYAALALIGVGIVAIIVCSLAVPVLMLIALLKYVFGG